MAPANGRIVRLLGPKRAALIGGLDDTFVAHSGGSNLSLLPTPTPRTKRPFLRPQRTEPHSVC